MTDVERPTLLSRLVPPTLVGYRKETLPSDATAGAVVAGMQIPQAMAYALLAGLPPQSGLYAAMLPLVAYGLLGTCRSLAVGPVAIVALMVGQAVANQPDPIAGATTLALLVATVLVFMALLRLGRFTELLAPPVIQGFLFAAAFLIGASQTKHVLGVTFAPTERPYEVIGEAVARVPDAHTSTLTVGLACLVALLFFRFAAQPLLGRLGVPVRVARVAARGGPLFVAAGAILWSSAASAGSTLGVAVVGRIPAGLPPLAVPAVPWTEALALLPSAVVIALVVYVQSFSMAQGLAVRRQERVLPDRELIALGAANLGAALCGGLPVAGGLSRSAVNDAAGARSGVATIVTAALVALTLAFGTAVLTDLPKAVLGAIILVAILRLLDVSTALRMWRSSRVEGTTLVATFAAVLLLGIELGLLVGVLVHTLAKRLLGRAGPPDDTASSSPGA